MGLLSAFLAACTGASSGWSRQQQTIQNLDGIATMPLPQQYRAEDYRTQRTPDFNSYAYRRPYKSHLNGQTSYAEDLTVTLLAPDFPRERLDRMLLSGDIGGFYRDPALGEADADGRRWVVRETVYEQHPVTEPSWDIRVDDPARGLVARWRGFKKEYTVEDARRNLSALLSSITVSPKIADDFGTRRSWAPTGWEPAYTANTKVVRDVLAEFKLELPVADAITRHDKWRIFLDDQRPQQLHLVHALTAITLPDGPFRITEPVTYFKYMQQRWVQDNQGQESDRLPVAGQKLMATELVDQERVYFYQMAAVDMWKTYSGSDELAKVLRGVINSMTTKHAKLMRAGFIAPDAEP